MTLIEHDGDVIVAEEVQALHRFHDADEPEGTGWGWTLRIYVRGRDVDEFEYLYDDEAQTRAAQQRFVNELARA